MATGNAALDAITQHLTPETIQQLSSSIGADPAATSKAVSLALPALLGGLAKNASSPDGAVALDRALDAHDGGILDNLGGLLGGGGGGMGGIGGAILGHIFGHHQGPVETGVAKGSGLDAQQVGRLLMMLAPIVMGVLGRMKRKDGIGASQLPDVLQQGAGGGDLASMAGSVLGGLFK
jgi:hypothetical protein